MNSAQKSQELENRLLKLGVAVIKELQRDKSTPQAIKTQLIRSITSIGANYLEANNASSKADFKHKIYICKKEAGESLYWMKLIRALKDEESMFHDTFKETDGVIKIFQKIITTMNKGPTNEK
jgi:four helix bundle protein